MDAITVQQQLFIKMVINAWNAQNKDLNKCLDQLSEEQFSNEISPGKNTGIYVLGHLVAISDGMLPLLDIGEKMFPDLQKIFVDHPDKSGLEKPSVATLKGYLEAVNAKLGAFIFSSTPEGWFTRHTAISETDFEKEPHRNKLNILINRTNHMAYHVGQLVLLKGN